MINVKMYEPKSKSVLPLVSLKNHIKYIEMIGKGNTTKTFLFNRHSNHLNTKDFYKKLNLQPVNGSPGHRVLITFDTEITNHIIIQLITETLHELEIMNNETYDWIGIAHIDINELSHVHIIIRGFEPISDEMINFKPSYIPKIKSLLEKHSSRFNINSRGESYGNENLSTFIQK